MSNLLSFGCSSKLAPNDRLYGVVGRPLADAECSIEALRQTGTTVRVIGRGMAHSKDRKENLVNVYVNQNGNIVAVRIMMQRQ